MSAPAAQAFRCTVCGAPLPLTPVRDDILRCEYCGNDHRLTPRADQSAQQIKSEPRLGVVFGPYLLAPAVGAVVALAARDWWLSAYRGWPAIGLAVLFVVIAAVGVRIAAVSGLLLLGVAGVLKPFLRGVPGYEPGELASPTSEAALYYLIPGAVALAICIAVLARLRAREVKSALQAIRPRPTVVLAFAGGVALGHFAVGPTAASLLRQHAGTIDELVELSRLGCRSEPSAGSRKLEPPPFHANEGRDPATNTVVVSCAALARPGESEADPLFIGQLSKYRSWQRSNVRWLRQGATGYLRRGLAELERARYLVVYEGSKLAVTARIVDRKQRRVVARVTAGGTSFSETRAELWQALAAQTGGRFSSR